MPVPVEESAAFGVLGVDERQRVRSFIEKPQPSSLGLSGQRTVLASMGVYVFNTSYLEQQLKRDAGEETSAHDFGRDILPRAVRDHQRSRLLFRRCRRRSGLLARRWNVGCVLAGAYGVACARAADGAV